MAKKLLFALISLLVLGGFVGIIYSQEWGQTEVVPRSCTMRNNLSNTPEQQYFNCPGPGEQCDFTEPSRNCPACCIIDGIYTVTNMVFLFLIAVVIILVLIGAYNIITAGGNPDKVKTGRDFILWAAAGLIVALFAKAIPALARMVIRTQVGGGGGGGGTTTQPAPPQH